MRRILFATVAASAIVLAPFVVSAQTAPAQNPTAGAPTVEGAPPGAPPAMPPPADTPAAPGPSSPTSPSPAATPAAPPTAAPAASNAAPAPTVACTTQNTTVFFVSGSAELDSQAQNAVTQPITQSRSCTLSAVEVAGFSDAAGSEDANLRLSELRAAAVREALVAQGVSADIVRVEGRGEAGATGDAERDRRAEVRLVFAAFEPAAAAPSAAPAPPAASDAPAVAPSAPAPTPPANDAPAAPPAPEAPAAEPTPPPAATY
jgi:outer membrane protein OmpA-like peptidoglycan-associated protein